MDNTFVDQFSENIKFAIPQNSPTNHVFNIKSPFMKRLNVLYSWSSLKRFWLPSGRQTRES